MIGDREIDEVVRIARLASDCVARVYAGPFTVEMKGPGDPVTAADREANEIICRAIEASFPGDSILAEESVPDDPAEIARRVAAPRVWFVDPLDGTREFGTPGRSDWAVHVALSVDGVPAAGAVALPAHGLVLSTPEPGSAPRLDGPVRIVVSRTRPPEFAYRAAHALDAEMVPMGSAGAKAMAVVLGDADAYIHAGGQYEWDSCAPAAVAAAAGLWCSRLDGSPLRYNRPDPYLPDLVICRPELADTILTAGA